MIISSLYHQPPLEWAQIHFQDLDLGDLRRDDRAVTIAAAMAQNPDHSLPQLFFHPYDLKAAYNLFKHHQSSPDNLQSSHRELVFEHLNKPGRYLLLEDTTDLSWAGNKPISGLGPIGSGAKGLQGLHLHSTLAVRWDLQKDDCRPLVESPNQPRRPPVEVIGLADQQYLIRKRRPKSKKKNSSRASNNGKRESQCWDETTQRIGEAPQSDQLEWIRVCDRGADIYEFLIGCLKYGHRFVVRAAQDRALTEEGGGRSVGRLFEVARQQNSLGKFKLELRARNGQRAREAELNISYKQIELRSPQRPGSGVGSLQPVRCTVVRVWEQHPPKAVNGLEWILLTDLCVKDFWTALEVALIYASRWIIEEFHKGLKSGTKAEELQLERAEALFAAIAIKSVVALRLIEIRERVRIEPDRGAEQAGLTEEELGILRAASRREIKTVREVALAIGRLGGHLNRKGDGMPGWQTLMRGMTKLSNLVEGARLALKLKKFG